MSDVAEAFAPFLARPIAHRGLHERAAGVIENSLAAFDAAVEGNYGVELDIQMSADGEAMAFHDEGLSRLTGRPGLVREYDAAALGQLRLVGAGDDQRVPTLGEVMARIAGRVALLIEIKDQDGRMGGGVGRLERRIAELIASYDGPVAIQSFNPWTVGWFADHAPHIPRGFISYDHMAPWSAHIPPDRRAALRALKFDHAARAHFIAYGIKSLPYRPVAEARAAGTPILTWTVRTERERRIAAENADNIIFEGWRA